MRASNVNHAADCVDEDLQSDLRNCALIHGRRFHRWSKLLSTQLLILNLAYNRWYNSCRLRYINKNIHSEKLRPQSCWNLHHHSCCAFSWWYDPFINFRLLTYLSQHLPDSDLHNWPEYYCKLDNLHCKFRRIKFSSAWSNKNYFKRFACHMSCFTNWYCHKHRWSNRLDFVYIHVRHS